MHQMASMYPELAVYRNDEPIPDKLYETNPDLCCDILKVQPTRRAIEEMDAACWVTGLRCTEGRTRTDFQEAAASCIGARENGKERTAVKQLRDRLIAEMKQYFGEDERRVSHALEVTGFAEQILLEEEGDEDIVIAAAILHDIGIHEAERKYGSNAGHYQEIEGPPIAREILKRQGLGDPFIEEVCEIIGNHHSPGKVNTNNFRIVYDADCLVNLSDEFGRRDAKELSRRIDKVFLTPTGKRIARGRK
jgi:hypothetical protein